MIGQKIAHYHVTAKIGAGGMGEVYRATDTKLNRDVALKVLPQEFAADAQRMARFQREAQVLASLNHPNIAAIYGLEESGTGFQPVVFASQFAMQIREPVPLVVVGQASRPVQVHLSVGGLSDRRGRLSHKDREKPEPLPYFL